MGSSSKLRGLSREEFQKLRLELQNKGALTLHAHGDSMTPLIQSGQVLEVEVIKDPKDLRRFDPIIYWQDGALLCHYLWRLNRVFMQDENVLLQTRPLRPLSGLDSPVPLTQVLGRPRHIRLSLWTRVLILMHALFMKRF